MEQVKDVSELVFVKARGGRFRWLTISTLMLAIGMLLHLVSPSVAGFTPNWMIATYVVAILLTKPTYKQCLGICMVAALMEVFTSKSAFPYGADPDREIFPPSCHRRLRDDDRLRLHLCFHPDACHGDPDEGISLRNAPDGGTGRRR